MLFMLFALLIACDDGAADTAETEAPSLVACDGNGFEIPAQTGYPLIAECMESHCWPLAEWYIVDGVLDAKCQGGSITVTWLR